MIMSCKDIIFFWSSEIEHNCIITCRNEYSETVKIVCSDSSTLTNAEDDWLQKGEEVEAEETTRTVAAVDEEKGPRIDLSHLTMPKGMNALTFLLSQSSHQSILLRTESPLSIDLEPPLLDLPPQLGPQSHLIAPCLSKFKPPLK